MYLIIKFELKHLIRVSLECAVSVFVSSGE